MVCSRKRLARVQEELGNLRQRLEAIGSDAAEWRAAAAAKDAELATLQATPRLPLPLLGQAFMLPLLLRFCAFSMCQRFPGLRKSPRCL